jgi:two-component sensor histidine kinase
MEVLTRDGRDIFYINAKLSFLKYISSIVINKELYEIYDSIPYDQAEGFFGLVHERDKNCEYNLINTYVHLSEELQNQLIALNKRKVEDESRARMEERNKVIADLSHSIKNLISTVIDPLENLKEEKVVKPAVIQNALRGANLVREIVNAMNLSFKGSIEDFYHDARNNTDKGRMDMQSIIVESLIYSIGNMFDGKYFSNFVRKYFPSKGIFEEAKSEWTRISQSNDIQKITTYLQKYFLQIDLSIVHAANHVVGNERGSAIKLLILFQEIISNAVKYSAFVNQERRFLRIVFDCDPEQVSLKVENRYQEKVKTKTSGIGHVIVENFARLLNTEPVIKKERGIYFVEIKFVNFWGKESR